MLAAYHRALKHATVLPWRGRVLNANGLALTSDGPAGRIGDECEVRTADGKVFPGQIIGFECERVLIMLLHGGGGGERASSRGVKESPGSAAVPEGGIRFGDEVVGFGRPPRLAVSDHLLGRVVNANGEAIDGGAGIEPTQFVPFEPNPPRPFDRVPIDEPLQTGIRAIDGLMPVGKGQRVAIFGGSGVGKSTLLGMLTRNCNSDVVVIGLVGERGREVLEFVNESLGKQGRAKSVVVVGTSDEAPLLKMRSALSATSIAEYFASQGRHVLLIVDSLTRFAMAAREIGLAAGEPPTNRGYTPSVYSGLARMVERAGRFRRGSITAFYTVLMEGDDEQDPIVDAVRSFVDGHVLLSRELALEGWYPPIDILRSVSRLMRSVADPAHLSGAASVRKQLAVYARSEDLIRIGAYKSGADPDLDRAIAKRLQVRGFLNQTAHRVCPFAEALEELEQLVRETTG
jgi:flagellum-specific ATP synthase